ncbi:tyrosyl-DNA phosphodiesterase 2-like isoform X1 [Mizuhopecten yessoensis]|uniref:tyrosyl-DNA phosphodiesterase 2-like isoform X1 n=1 Tax=Mizuhopecten yessoensis TaxID=6573 RepID=UPI000B4597B4|nr:tyrosyl-DNA phosphodiesterase 2-like isoform X1 [Mizuhopecten yessoensis]XP_021379385.1 tyrosyl-DNA phosphodiesterase 2-like isoform X1 [Mizuhopecten yessoensis]
MGDDGENSECSEKKSRVEESDPEPHRIRLLSWNIDGLHDLSIKRRTQAVCDIINKEHPHVVFLQEVTALTQVILESGCPTYQVITGGNEEYYTCILLKVDQVELIHHQTLPFPDTRMMRNLLLVQVARIGGLPPGVHDIWEITGQRPEAAYTWDMSRNDNLVFSGKFRPKLRFDRLYIRGAEPPTVEPVYLELVGLERVAKCGKYPSDHWGLLAHYNILSKVKSLASKVK